MYMAVQSGIRDARKKKTTGEIIARNKKLREFYDKKREEGKPFRVQLLHVLISSYIGFLPY